jgi:acyl-CoA synthetase (AMP-forming)/AMP-acid ligase II
MLNLAMVIEDSAFKAGAVVVPLNPLLSAPEFAYHLKDSDALRAWSRARSDRDRAGQLSQRRANDVLGDADH